MASSTFKITAAEEARINDHKAYIEEKKRQQELKAQYNKMLEDDEYTEIETNKRRQALWSTIWNEKIAVLNNNLAALRKAGGREAGPLCDLIEDKKEQAWADIMEQVTLDYTYLDIQKTKSYQILDCYNQLANDFALAEGEELSCKQNEKRTAAYNTYSNSVTTLAGNKKSNFAKAAWEVGVSALNFVVGAAVGSIVGSLMGALTGEMFAIVTLGVIGGLAAGTLLNGHSERVQEKGLHGHLTGRYLFGLFDSQTNAAKKVGKEALLYAKTKESDLSESKSFKV